MGTKAQYVIKQTDNVNIDDYYIVSKLLLFKVDALIPSNDGAYAHTRYINTYAIHTIYVLKNGFSSRLK